MKNKRGFTLVEVLAVIVVLSIIMIIAVPNVLKSLNATKTAIDIIEQKAIEDGAKQVILEVLHCEITDKTRNVLNVSTTVDCNTLQNKVIGKTIEIKIIDLKNNGYFNDNVDNCTADTNKIKVTTDNNYKMTFDTSGINCKK